MVRKMYSVSRYWENGGLEKVGDEVFFGFNKPPSHKSRVSLLICLFSISLASIPKMGKVKKPM
jgi:hypothetical protein